MVKMYGLEYKVFERLDLLPPEILDLLNIFSINKKYILYGNTVLEDFRAALSAEGVEAIYNYYEGMQDNPPDADAGLSSTVISSVIDVQYPVGGNYYDFVVNAFESVISGFLSLSYSDGGRPIYMYDGDDGVYEDLANRRSRYMEQFKPSDDVYSPYMRRRYKMLNGVPLQFDESAALDRIEAGLERESIYSGPKAELIQLERQYRARQIGQDRTGRYAFYKKRRVLEYANFVVDKYYSDNKNEDFQVY